MIYQYYKKRNKVKCPICGHSFNFKLFLTWLMAPHLFDRYRFWKCPKCGVRTWMKVERSKKNGSQ